MGRWEDAVVALFDDLEQQAEGLQLLERDAEVADLTQAEYARIALAARLHASVGGVLRLRLLGGRLVSGRLSRVGQDWLLLADQGSEWVLRTAAVASLSGVSPRATHEDTRSVLDTLSLRHVLRRVAGDAEPVLVHLLDEQRLEGRVGRVGADFFELHVGHGPDRVVEVVPVTGVAGLQGRRTP
jgi:hypothetical protein